MKEKEKERKEGLHKIKSNLNFKYPTRYLSSLADSQNQNPRSLPGFLPRATNPDQNSQEASSNPRKQARQQPDVSQPSSFLPTATLPPGLEYLSQVCMTSLSTRVFSLKERFLVFQPII